MIRLENLRKTYGDGGKTLTVLNGVSYKFPASGSVAIVGRSGIGKSTLLHLMGGLDSPSEGDVIFGETRFSRLAREEISRLRGKQIGFIFQFHHLLNEFDARENIAMPLFIHGKSEEEAFAMADDMLREVGLLERANHRPGELSGGEQQRVAVARALVTSPRVILADEPTGNLDMSTAKEVQELLLRLNTVEKSLLVVVTHSHELAASLDFVVEMKTGGKLVAQ